MTLIHGTQAFSSPLVPQSGHSRTASPVTGIRTCPAVGSLERMNVTLPVRFGEAYHAYHAYHAHFCHFPRTPAIRKASAASGPPRQRRKIAARGLNTLNTHFLAISREARKASPASAGQKSAEKSPQRKPGAHRAHTLAISREPRPFSPTLSRQAILTHRA